MPPVVIAAAIMTAGQIGVSIYQTSAEASQRKKTLAAQAATVKAAEEKARAAEALAGEEAKMKLKKFRLSQTQTILTGPLGIADKPEVGKTTLGA